MENKKQGLFLTQEDIDKALRAPMPPGKTDGGDEVEALALDEADIVAPESEDSEYFGLLSKEDIEALLHGDLLAPERDAQDEVDSLLASADSEANTETSVTAGRPDKKNTDQDDVERLLQRTVDDAPAAGSEVSEEEGAVSQDDIDRLLMGAIDEPEEDSDPRLDAVPEASENGGVISQSDIDRLLVGDTDQIDTETAADLVEEPIETPETPTSRNDDSGLISQTDLDRLMEEALSGGDAGEPVARSAPAPTEHISQSDINRLLKESLEEEALSEAEEEEDAEAIEEAEAAEPVILAADEKTAEPAPSAPSPPPAPASRKKVSGRLKKKRLFAGVAACVLFVLAISIAMKRPEQKETVPKPQVLTFSISQQSGAATNTQPISAKSLLLTGFVVLAPPNPAAVTYVSTDLLLDLSEAPLVDLVKENEAYVRDIIYGAIKSELMTREIANIDKISLESAIRKELGRIVPRGAIKRLDLEKFSLV